jgi:uncharacterized membrane protein
LFSLFRNIKRYFSPEERQRIVEAVQKAETNTSGEIRVFIESRCSFMDALDRAKEIFSKLQMQNTAQRNAVLVYVAIKDRQLAILGDEGIHEKVGDEYWNDAVKKMITHFNRNNYTEGIRECVLEIGEALKNHFPYNKDTDINELPDDIVFGR